MKKWTQSHQPKENSHIYAIISKCKTKIGWCTPFLAKKIASMLALHLTWEKDTCRLLATFQYFIPGIHKLPRGPWLDQRPTKWHKKNPLPGDDTSTRVWGLQPQPRPEKSSKFCQNPCKFWKLMGFFFLLHLPSPPRIFFFFNIESPHPQENFLVPPLSPSTKISWQWKW